MFQFRYLYSEAWVKMSVYSVSLVSACLDWDNVSQWTVIIVSVITFITSTFLFKKYGQNSWWAWDNWGDFLRQWRLQINIFSSLKLKGWMLAETRKFRFCLTRKMIYFSQTGNFSMQANASEKQNHCKYPQRLSDSRGKEDIQLRVKKLKDHYKAVQACDQIMAYGFVIILFLLTGFYWFIIIFSEQIRETFHVGIFLLDYVFN